MTDKEKIKGFILNNKEQFTKWGDAAAEMNLHSTMEANVLLVKFCDSLISFIDALPSKEEPISEKLEKENKIKILADIIFDAAKHGYMPYDSQDEYCAMEIARKDIDKFIVPKKQEEPVSIDFEQELYNYFGQVKDFTLGMRIAKRFYDMGKNSQEPVSEDLMDATNNYCANVRKGYPRVKDETDRYICNAFKAGAMWQKQQTITKACDWLKRNADSYTWYNEFEGESGVTDDFVDEFKKEIQ